MSTSGDNATYEWQTCYDDNDGFDDGDNYSGEQHASSSSSSASSSTWPMARADVAGQASSSSTWPARAVADTNDTADDAMALSRDLERARLNPSAEHADAADAAARVAALARAIASNDYDYVGQRLDDDSAMSGEGFAANEVLFELNNLQMHTQQCPSYIS
jgi:hypothetical protein